MCESLRLDTPSVAHEGQGMIWSAIALLSGRANQRRGTGSKTRLQGYRIHVVCSCHAGRLLSGEKGQI